MRVRWSKEVAQSWVAHQLSFEIIFLVLNHHHSSRNHHHHCRNRHHRDNLHHCIVGSGQCTWKTQQRQQKCTEWAKSQAGVWPSYKLELYGKNLLNSRVQDLRQKLWPSCPFLHHHTGPELVEICIFTSTSPSVYFNIAISIRIGWNIFRSTSSAIHIIIIIWIHQRRYHHQTGLNVNCKTLRIQRPLDPGITVAATMYLSPPSNIIWVQIIMQSFFPGIIRSQTIQNSKVIYDQLKNRNIYLNIFIWFKIVCSIRVKITCFIQSFTFS